MTDTDEAPDFVLLPSGEALPASNLRLVTARDRTTVVLLAGPVASGKTTILVSLYELFNQGPVAGLLFGGSVTLAGFERICHAGREVSGGLSAETVRTNPSSGAAFLHLRVADVTGPLPRSASILISDVTGEAFVEARDVAEPTIIQKPVWRRANMVCVVLDGKRLATPTKRQVVRAEARSLLRAARESKLLAGHCRLSVVTTKWDLIVAPEARDFVDTVEAELRDQYSNDFSTTSFHRIAARPESTEVPYAFGVPALLAEWVAPPAPMPSVALPVKDARSGFASFATSFWQREGAALASILNAH